MSRVSVDAGAYRMVLNIMERTADRIGYPAMREAADELRKTAEVIESRPAPAAAAIGEGKK